MNQRWHCVLAAVCVGRVATGCGSSSSGVVPPRYPASKFCQSEWVFTARVTSVTPEKAPASSAVQVRRRLALGVEEVLKGEVPLLLTTFASGGTLDGVDHDSSFGPQFEVSAGQRLLFMVRPKRPTALHIQEQGDWWCSYVTPLPESSPLRPNVPSMEFDLDGALWRRPDNGKSLDQQSAVASCSGVEIQPAP